MKNVLFFGLILALLLSLPFPVNAQPMEEVGMSARPLADTRVYGVRDYFREQRINNSDAFLAAANYDNGAYSDSPANKMGTGMVNTATCWVDVPEQVKEVSQKQDLLAGMTLGVAQGFIQGIGRGVSGILDMATFGLPPYDEPIVEPAYRSRDTNKEFQTNLLEW